MVVVKLRHAARKKKSKGPLKSGSHLQLLLQDGVGLFWAGSEDWFAARDVDALSWLSCENGTV